MKITALLCMILILPLIASGLNFKQYTNPSVEDNNSFIRKQLVPSFNQTRNRNWRLEALEYQTDSDLNGVLEHDELFDYFYNNIYPARIDSIWVLHWVTAFENWGYEYTKKFIYDASGEYVTQAQYYVYVNPIPFILIDCVYDTQNRLTDTYFRTINWADSSYVLNQRINFAYNANSLAQMMNIYPGPGRAYYERFIVDSDANGRIETAYGTASPDSLNWGNFSLEELTYHANDTSTGWDYINFMSHNLLYIDDWNGLYGMLDTYSIFREWNGTGWNNFYFDTYNYNASDQVTDILTQFMDVSLVNESLHHYEYDLNNNLSYITNQLWNVGSNAWELPDEKYIYNWGQFTHIEDNTVTPVTLRLTVFPNPFNNSVNISLESKSNAPVKTSIYNIKGQLIKILDSSKNTSITWDGEDEHGKPVSNGIYFIRAEQDGRSVSRKVIRIK